MEREEGRRDWRTVIVIGDGSVANVKTNQTKLEAELCLARSRLVNPAGSYTTLNDWTPRTERGRIVSVVVMGRCVGIWNKTGDVIKKFAITEDLRENVKAYLREMNFMVNNTDSFTYLDEFKAGA